MIDIKIQYNLNGSNMDGSLTVDESNSFFIPYKILPIAQENKYLMILFLFYHGIVGDSDEYTSTQSLCRKSKILP